MFDVFTDQIEVLIKDGVANLYWYKGDLHKAWLRAGIPATLTKRISLEIDSDGKPLSKRRQMDRLYEELRDKQFNERLEISRNFVRLLVEHRNFVPQDPRHRIETAERSALKLREIITTQRQERDARATATAKYTASPHVIYQRALLSVRREFESSCLLSPQQRGYALEKIFAELMRISGISVESPFRIVGEQLDGAIKHEGCFYLIELKWLGEALEPKHIGSFYFKVEGKLGARGIVIAMNGYTSSVCESIPKGKELRVILLDGVHLANVIYGQYTFQQLLNYAIKAASLQGQIYCLHNLE